MTDGQRAELDSASRITPDNSVDQSLTISPALSTVSVSESIFEYEWEHGRSYHAFKGGKYPIPNDERELDRMDVHYHGVRLALGERHFIAPVRNPTSILDVGTGTGIWAMDVADDFPDAQVIGVDLSPSQPSDVPPNLHFQIMDADDPWDFIERFDLVHTRVMNGFSIKSWPDFYEKAFACMKPGGWVENQEFDLRLTADDGTMSEDGAVRKWENHWTEGIRAMGLESRCYPERMKQQMEEAGFINVQIRTSKLPLGPWPKDKKLKQAGIYLLYGMLEGVMGLSQKVFLNVLGWTQAELEVLLGQVRQEFRNRTVHSYFPIYVVYGQKPPA